MKALFKHLHTSITDTYATWPSEYTYVSGDQEHRFVRQDDERWGQLLHRHDGHVAPLDYGCTASVAIFVKEKHSELLRILGNALHLILVPPPCSDSDGGRQLRRLTHCDSTVESTIARGLPSAYCLHICVPIACA